jgi:hypothetical protein
MPPRRSQPLALALALALAGGALAQPVTYSSLGEGYLEDGNDVMSGEMPLAAAEALCTSLPACCGITFVGNSSTPSGNITAYLKSALYFSNAAGWQTFKSSRPCPEPPPYPGPPWMQTKVTNAPPCVYAVPNWHDVAGALYFEGAYHVFQGCGPFLNSSAGWHHAVSTNLVDWQNLGTEPGLSVVNEPYGASSPCSGFVTVDDDGVPCAGFRECGGNWPGRSNAQVPLEFRCAKNAALTDWTGPEYAFWFYFNRNLPYDPVRPWKDTDGQWYATISADACNNTVPCYSGGAEFLYTSPRLRGPGANWTLLPNMLFNSSWTVLTPYDPTALELNEFVTAG